MEVGDVQLGVEGRVGSDGAVVRGEQVLCGGHLVDRRDETDGSRVAGASSDLETVGEGGFRKGEGAVVDVVTAKTCQIGVIFGCDSTRTWCWSATGSGQQPGGFDHRQRSWGRPQRDPSLW